MSVMIIIVIAYMAVMFLVSAIASRVKKSKNSDDFLLAGRGLPVILIACMVTGSAVGGVSTVGVAQNAFKFGLSAGFYNVAWAIGALLAGLFLVQKIRATGLSTPNQMFKSVYGDAFATVVLIVFILAMTMNIGNQLVSAGSILTGILPSMSLNTAMICSTALFIGIALIGGMWGAAVTNLVNVIVIYVGIAVCVIVLYTTNGGFGGMNAALPQEGYDWWSPVKGAGTVTIVAWIINLCVSCVNSGSIFQTVVSAKSPKDGKKGILLAALFIAPCGFLCALLGIGCRALYPELADTKLVLPTILQAVPQWVAGLCLAGLWAAVVSTAIAIIMGIGLMASKDLIVKYFAPNMGEKNRILTARFCMVALGLVGMLIGMRLSNIVGTMMAALSLMTPLSVLIVGFFLLPPRLSRKSTCWWAWGMGSAAYLACTFINTGWKIGGQAIYTTLLFTLLGYTISLLVDKRLAQQIKYVETL